MRYTTHGDQCGRLSITWVASNSLGLLFAGKMLGRGINSPLVHLGTCVFRRSSLGQTPLPPPCLHDVFLFTSSLLV